MNLVPNLNIDILSGHFKPKAKKWRVSLIILLILLTVYTFLLSRLIEYKTISIVIYSILGLLIIFFGIAYKYFIDRFEVIGAMIFNSNKIKIKIKKETNLIEVNMIKELRFELTGYYDQPFKFGPKLKTENGNQNYLTILTDKTTLTFELCLESSLMLKSLKNYLDYYADNDIKTNIIKI